MTIKERQKTILGEVVREYIRTARPVSSSEIAPKFKKGFSSATIRHEMLELCREGYLDQPHTSAGRVPTDRGYRFFVDNLLDDISLNAREKKLVDGIFANCATREFVSELAKAASAISKSFALSGLFEEEIISKTGFSKVLDEPEFSESKNIQAFGHFIDHLDEDVYSLMSGLEEELEEETVFIGGENPLKEAENISMLASIWRHPKGYNGFLVMIGPKRMDYGRNYSFLRYLRGK